MTTQVEEDVQTDIPAPSIEDIMSQLKEKEALIEQLNAENAKYRHQKNKASQELKELKSKPPATDNSEDIKSYAEQLKSELDTWKNKARTEAVSAAVKTQLLKAGVRPEAIDLAIKAVGDNTVQWSEDDGVDSITVDVAVRKVKNEYGFLFEKKVPNAQPKQPSDGKASSDTDISRSDFERLDPVKRLELIRKGIKITD